MRQAWPVPVRHRMHDTDRGAAHVPQVVPLRHTARRRLTAAESSHRPTCWSPGWGSSRRNQSTTKRSIPSKEEPPGGLSAFVVRRAAKKPLTRGRMHACPECPLHELRMCDALAWLSECRLHVAAAMRSREGPPSQLRRSGPSAPVFDAVVVGCEAVADAPQNRLGAAGDVDLAIARS